MATKNTAVTGSALDWDSTIEDDGQQGGGFVLLPEGDYKFTVTGLERGRHEGSAKIGACPKALLTLTVETDAGDAQVKTSLLLHSSMEWKLSSFFRSLGMKKHGQRLNMDWSKVLGSEGLAHFTQRTFVGNDGLEKKTNDVKYFIDHMPLQQEETDDIPF